MDTEKVRQSLNFIETKGHFKWTSDENEFKLFVEKTTTEATDSNWEEDQHHNMLTFKSKDTVIKWYRGTKTLIVQGNKHKEYKKKLHGLLEDSSRIPNSGDDEEVNETEDPNESDRMRPEASESACRCSCKTVLDSLKKLQQDVTELQNKIPLQPQNMQMNVQLHLEEEVKYLKGQINELEDRNSTLISTNTTLRERITTLESERESLITANRLLYEDMKIERDNNANDNNADFITVHHKHKPQGNRLGNKTSSDANHNTSNKPNQPGATKTKAGKDAPRKSVVVLGDSTVKDLKGWKMSQTKKIVIQSFPGATVNDMQHYIKPTIDKKPDEIILHVGTNDLASATTPRQLAEKIVDLGVATEREAQDTKITISSIIHRADDAALQGKAVEANKILKQYCSQHKWGYIDNRGIGQSYLNKGGLHLNSRGTVALAKNIIQYVKDD